MNEDDDVGQMIADCEKRESRMTEWEATFVDSISKQVADGRALSAKQTDRLIAIWDRVTGNG